MKAMLRHTYGSPDVLGMAHIDTPTPRADEVLIQVRAASVNAADWRMLRADPFLARLDVGLLTPRNKILGFDVAGRVDAVGEAVSRFKPGDAVFGNLFELRGGAFAEYVAAPERLLVHKPSNLSFEQAAAVPMAGVTALRGLRRYGQLEPGRRVLINGASGGVGTFAVQLAKAFGAEVTAVVSRRNIDQARALGADQVVDYTSTDFTQSGERYDLILAVNGYQPIAAYQRALRPGGHYVMAGGSSAQLLQALLLGPWLSRKGDTTIAVLETKPGRDDLEFLKERLEAGTVVPVVDRTYSLCQLPDAIRYLEAGHARGKVVVSVSADGLESADPVSEGVQGRVALGR
ncbi:MAG: NAD(P)-dependent alcohol dehydrogenase [Anaerolineales bacterium]|nr:NAD(P)-dependent alcohol dehydrogenase [Anaerolineales bacterium]